MRLKMRLTVMNFLEYAVWGAYLTSMGSYLVKIGMAENIGWFIRSRASCLCHARADRYYCRPLDAGAKGVEPLPFSGGRFHVGGFALWV